MFSLGSAKNYSLYCYAYDMNESFNRFCWTVNNELKQKPLNGSLFVFLDR